MADQEKIVITGIGVVSSIGIGKEAFWASLKEGKSGIKPVTLFDTSKLNSKLAGEISDFKPEEILGLKGLRNLDRTTLLALSAAKLCLDDAQFEVNEQNGNDVGVVLGSTMGSVWSISEFDKEGLREGVKMVNPAAFPNTVMNSSASQISIRFGIKGFNTTLSSGFTSSLEALAYAKRFLMLGRAKAVLVGGVEELCEQTYKGSYKVGFLSGSRNNGPEICAPFDRRRNGAVLGEGACVFLVETKEHALKRGAHIYAEIGPIISNCDIQSYNRYNVRSKKTPELLERIFKQSGISAKEVDYIASAANSTLLGDAAEFHAIESAFNGTTRLVDVSSSKSMIGETFSASGAFQIASALLAIEQNVIPPTINYEVLDERCPVNCVPNKNKTKKVKNCLVLNISPMGQNSTLVLSK